MTYLGFLVLFLILPTLLLMAMLVDRWRRGQLSVPLRMWSLSILIHTGIALTYTTPWDNFLVAHGVWTYDPNRVTGWLVGWVPLEEYLFFILQPILVGLWLGIRWKNPRNPHGSLYRAGPRWRWGMTAVGIGLWVANLAIWRWGGPSWTYMGLILVWGLPPFILQMAFGGDLWWDQKKNFLKIWLPPAIYLSIADALAIREGIWRISVNWSTGCHILGLPIEEGVFFFLTTGLLTSGSLLMILPESQTRLQRIHERVRDGIRMVWGKADPIG